MSSARSQSAGGQRRRIINDNIQGLSNPAISRLAHTSSAKYISSMIYEEVRGLAKVFVEEMVKRAVLYAEHGKRKTITHEDALYALELIGRKMYFTGDAKLARCSVRNSKNKKNVAKDDLVDVEMMVANGGADDKMKKKKRKAHPGTQALRNIRFYQNNSADCVHFAMEPFARFVREVGGYYSNDVRFSKMCMNVIQLATEAYLIDIFNDAVLAALHAHRQKVTPADIELVKRIRKN